MATVRFNLKRKNAGKTAILAMARWNGQIRKYYTGESIEPQNWNNEKQEVKKNADMGINEILQAIKNRILVHIRTKQEFPKTIVEKRPKGRPKKPREAKATAIVKAIERYQTMMKNTGRAQKSTESYGTLIRHIEKFDPKNTPIRNVDAKFLCDFQGHMIAQNYANSHIAKMVRILQTVLDNEGHSVKIGRRKMIETKYSEQIYLTETEIEKIAMVNLSETPRQERARDIWMIAYYTGQRYSDINQVKIDAMAETVKITQEKTDQQVTIPVSNGLRKIFQKYPDGIKIPTNQEINRTIKHAAEKAGLTEIVRITHYRGGKSIIEETPKNELISCHTARRSFATNALLSGMPDNVVMKFTGHKTTSEFSRYIRATANQIAEKYLQHEFFRK